MVPAGFERRNALNLVLSIVARVTLLAGAIMLLAGVGQASAEVTLKGTLPITPQYTPYTLAPDDTFWLTTGDGTGGSVTHVDEAGNDLGDGFQVTGGYRPLTIGYYGGRVYVINGAGSGSHSLYSFRPGAGDTNPDPIYSDYDTNTRLGGTQVMMRVVGGSAFLTLGQDNKIMTLNLSGLGAAPFYPQFLMGWGINTPGDNSNAGYASCEIAAPPTPGNPSCGQFDARSGQELGHFNRPTDVAPSINNTFYVLELSADRVTVMGLPPEASGQSGPVPYYAFGSSGTGTGQLNQPSSIVRDAAGNLYISDSNRRISVFRSNGEFVEAFGWGVRTGAAAFETCSIQTGCQVGLNTEPRSNYGRLDINSDGELYANTPAGIQVFSLGGQAQPPPVVEPPPPATQPPPSTTQPPPPATQPSSPAKNKVTLNASRLQVEKGKRITLTATLTPCGAASPGVSVLFQEQAGRGWNALGKAGVDDACTAKRKVEVEEKSVFRAQSLSATRVNLATSPKVTVKVKRHR